MTQTPQTPPGWYPQGGQERWWDGNAWSEHYRPAQTQAAPYGQPPYGQPAYGQPAYGQPPYGQPYYAPAQKSHVARNLLIIFGVLFLLFVGGCFAVVAVVGHKVDETINDKTPGGPRVPLTVQPGQAFHVKDLDFGAGWTLGRDETGDAEVSNLTLTNNTGKHSTLTLTMSVHQGSVIVASIDCSSKPLSDGESTVLDCFSGDRLPRSYDKVTVTTINVSL